MRAVISLTFGSALLLCFVCACSLGGKSLKESRATYFPKEVMESEYQIEWYSEYLNAMSEPSLFTKKDGDSRSFRFLLIDGEKSVAQMVRLELFGDNRVLTCKKVRKGPSDIVILTSSNSIELPKSKAKEFLSLFARLEFFTMESQGGRGLGGAEWILEALFEGEYHVVVRWSPELASDNPQVIEFMKACNWLLRNCHA